MYFFFQGILFSTAECVKTPMDLVRLWMHECDRVYRDKLIDEKDMENYDRIQADITKKVFEVCAFLCVTYFNSKVYLDFKITFTWCRKKGRMEANGPSVPTYPSTEHMRSRPELAISYKSLYFSNLSLECVLLFAGIRKGLLSFQTNPKFMCK